VTAPLQDQLQRTLGDGYTLERELGGGGMSRVFVATERSLGRRVAVKVLPPDLAAAVSAERFRREILLAASLQHPHIVTVLTAGSSEGLPYYTMPLVDGESLRERIEREGKLPVADTIAILRDVAQALAYAHAHGVIHRDIKPANILLSGGVAMVADFGVAKAIRDAGAGGGGALTSVGMALGTPAYMAPEQGSGDPASDLRSDLYALGAVGYEMLSGQQLFPGRTPQQVLVAHAVQAPRPVAEQRPDTPPALAALIMRCLEKDPAKRPASAEDVRKALDAMTLGAAATQRSRGRRAMAAAAVAVVAAALAGAAWMYAARRAASSPDGDRSIAVLPFENASGQHENDYFSDGMAEELINGLSKVPGLRVAARTSAFAFRGKDADIRDIGRKLNVGTVLEGSVRSAGSRIRVSARLVDATNGYQLWSDEYEREATDVFRVQDDLARAIVGALKLHLAPGSDASPVRRGTKSVDAYNKYLRGRYFFEQRSREGFARGVQYFSEAIAADSGYAAAWSGLADCLMLSTTFGFAPPRSLMPQARAAAERAVQLDPSLAEAHTSLGFVYLLYDYDYPAGEAQLRRAIELDPRYATALLFHSWYDAAVGKTADAVREVQQALAIDPFSIILNARLGTMLYYDRQFQAAIDQSKRTLELAPHDGISLNGIARSDLALGNCADALRYAKEGKPNVGPWEGPVLGYVAARCGDPALARRELQERLDAVKAGQFVPADVIAKIYAGLGDRANALDWLERAYDERVWSMTLLTIEPMYDNLRGDPRFQSLVSKMNPK